MENPYFGAISSFIVALTSYGITCLISSFLPFKARLLSLIGICLTFVPLTQAVPFAYRATKKYIFPSIFPEEPSMTYEEAQEKIRRTPLSSLRDFDSGGPQEEFRSTQLDKLEQEFLKIGSLSNDQLKSLVDQILEKCAFLTDKIAVSRLKNLFF